MKIKNLIYSILIKILTFYMDYVPIRSNYLLFNYLIYINLIVGILCKLQIWFFNKFFIELKKKDLSIYNIIIVSFTKSTWYLTILN